MYPYPYYQQTNNIPWVQGVEAAKAYPVAPGNAVFLMDSETQRFYIKTVDSAGIPAPIRAFEYSEISNAPAPEKYVTREEFNKLIAELKGEMKDAEPSV